MLRIALVDGDAAQHATFRTHLAANEPDWQLDAHTHGEMAFPTLRAAPPQLVLLERTLPDGCGLEWLRRCKREFPQLPTIIVTTQGDAKTLLTALLAGARGYYVKFGDGTDLVKHLRKVLAGKLALCDQAERLLPAAFALMRPRGVNQWGLSRREQEIMHCLCEQKTEKEISRELGIETGTVHVHLMKIYKKLDAHNRALAIRTYLAAIHGRG